MISRSGIHSLGRMFTLTAVMLNLSFLRSLRSCLVAGLAVLWLLNMADSSLRSSHFTLKYASSVMEKSLSDTCSRAQSTLGGGGRGDHLGNIFDVNLDINPHSVLVQGQVILLVIIRKTYHVLPSFVAVTFRKY